MLLRLENVEYTYNPGTALEKQALRNVSLSVDKGEFLGVIGHTGSGKSTLIQLLNGLLKPTAGHIYFNDADIHDPKFSLQELRFHVGLVFQYPEYQLFESDVLKDVCFGPKNKGMAAEEQLAVARRSLSEVGIEEKLYKKSPFELSGGQKRRVAIAGVLAMDPEVLVLDEPTAGLDPRGRDEILDRIANLQKERGITVILVSHSMDDIARLVDRLVVMDHGEKRYDAAPKEVFSHAKELEKIGLSAPQMTYIMQALAERGWDVDPGAATIEEAKQSILQAIKKR